MLPADGKFMICLLLMMTWAISACALNPDCPAAQSVGAESTGEQQGVVPARNSQRLQKTFVVREYRYEPGSKNDDPVMGLSLCGPRCNGISESLANILKPGGWRLVKESENQEKRVSLDNPFMKGTCVCVGDIYSIDWFDPETGGERESMSK